MAVSFSTLGATAIQRASGQVVGVDTFTVFGRNTTVGTSFVPVAISGAFRTPQVSGATPLRIKAGGSSNDTAGGVGAREVTLLGLNALGASIEETLVTAGVSASVATSQSFLRLNLAVVTASGTYPDVTGGSHIGTITIEDSAGSEDWATIAIDGGAFAHARSEIGAYSIAEGVTGYIGSVFIFTDSNKETDAILFSRGNILETDAPYSPVLSRLKTKIQDGDFGEVSFNPVKIPGPADVGIVAKVGTGTAEVGVSLEIVLIKD